MDKQKPAELLRLEDLEADPVWMFVNDDARSETIVRPVRRLPVLNLRGKLVGAKVRLANGTELMGLLGNIHAQHPRKTEQYLSMNLLLFL